MEYKAKHKAWKELHSSETVEKDIELLRKKKPEANSLKSVKRFIKNNRGRLEKEILYELLDFASVKEIKDNRSEKISEDVVPESTETIQKPEAKSQPPAKKKSQKKKSTRK